MRVAAWSGGRKVLGGIGRVDRGRRGRGAGDGRSHGAEGRQWAGREWGCLRAPQAFSVIADGEADVVGDGTLIRTIGRGEGLRRDRATPRLAARSTAGPGRVQLDG
jgi:hypothetical protein